ncbi:DUF2249 domain-containing protein [Thiohalomonas denitrificans]|uniref:Uncharacterized conserved protein n=1 Tax=Thiohalomonas denitrificans TaxID=415747 RepID=A0A1G5QKI5_9GAMM|nr:DUF2249 domain-containing protein [Thiohalomonas denitrificans]SCZ61659.1 Uncharacterized conserved protein [Thiohalomonas denitrificans]
MANAVVLDVSELEPPEPLVLTLEGAARLQPGEYLRMRHRRVPYPLFDTLDQQGFGYLSRGGRDVACEVLIWREGDSEAARAAEAMARELPEWRE